MEESSLNQKAPDGIGGRVRSARERLGLKREELAVQAGLSWSAIAQIEAGRRTNLRPATLGALARTLRTTTDYLLGFPAGSGTAGHYALLFEGVEGFAAAAVAFVSQGLGRGEPSLVVASKRNVAAIQARLDLAPKEVRFESADAWYRSPASAFHAFRAYAEKAEAAGAPWVRIISEPTWKKWSAAQLRLWWRCEATYNLSLQGRPVTHVCSYDAGTLPQRNMGHVCETHPYIRRNGDVTPSAQYVDPVVRILAE